jgi:23S rRNA pseudouridine2605 synthase
LTRINKYLSLCGVTSRRGAEALIQQGRVVVNDVTLHEPGVVIDEKSDVVKVDGVVVQPVQEKVYVALFKPKNVMTTLHDPFKRKTVRHHLKGLKHRVYPVGRLDYDAEGLLILTNDGDLAYRLAHPRYQVPKVYEASVSGTFKRRDVETIRGGVKLEDGSVGSAEVSILRFLPRQTRIRLVLTEGRKREVKQLCKGVGHPVEELVRVEFAGLTIKNLRPGQWRALTDREVSRLKELVGL